MNKLLLLAALAAFSSPAMAGGVLICNPWGCRSTPYFPPPIYIRAPFVISDYRPAVRLPPPYPPLGPENPPPPAYPLAPERPPGLRPSYPPPYPPLGNPPKGAEEKGIENDILAFCDAKPDTPFCGRLGEYLRSHPRR
jgi:hypothetical protein